MSLANRDSSHFRAMGICSEFLNHYTVVLWIGAHLYISNCTVSDRKSINSRAIWHYCIKSLKNDVASFSYAYQEDHIGRWSSIMDFFSQSLIVHIRRSNDRLVIHMYDVARGKHIYENLYNAGTSIRWAIWTSLVGAHPEEVLLYLSFIYN